ncbi:hypothetical protein [Pseudooceanicola sp.]|uniref:hypothetical protein n=1 Tax=Pseudooceanicola sp. TaxID=1914328 RepID=UPI004057F8F6
MIVIIVFCIATDLSDRCVQTAEVAVASRFWINIPCEAFVPAAVLPRLISCTKTKPGEPV